jgi:hypothetical protein
VVVGINFNMASLNSKYQRSSPGQINDYAEAQFLCYIFFPDFKISVNLIRFYYKK